MPRRPLENDLPTSDIEGNQGNVAAKPCSPPASVAGDSNRRTKGTSLERQEAHCSRKPKSRVCASPKHRIPVLKLDTLSLRTLVNRGLRVGVESADLRLPCSFFERRRGPAPVKFSRLRFQSLFGDGRQAPSRILWNTDQGLTP